ncbi:MAG: hypothetical protein BGO45_09790 [Microbacterium sp. 71-36]|uniref:glycosyl hydrolase n=1 Tax=unclassified Microbacterium TaxID=2609290 RepID=UPI00086D40F6|nr:MULTISPECIES: glycosyl hydrolase [unclassified Microbacterium]MBN9212791.1 hypothetical protein [Microbacterium sp.]ODT39091.1 MAG: hypothetical protein ABS60_07885 [Microbacterium sp. SCN 71-17]OJV77097.1 MAG: hypothetical protein BGO45_09790 [Microbacterium sp. 71-36]
MVIILVVALVAISATAVLLVLRSGPGPLSVTSPSLLFSSASDVRIVLGNSHGAVTWTLRSRSGEQIATGQASGGPDAALEPPVPADGFYTLDLADDRDTLSVNFLVNPAPDATDRFFSVATHWGKSSFAAGTWPVDATASLLRGLGFREVRDETSWMSVERVRGERAIPPHAEDLHTVTQDNGMKMLFVAGYGNPVAYPDDMKENLSPPTTPEGRQGYVDYINTVLDADPQIDKVEVWNEFNRPQRNTSDCQSGDCYATLVKAVYKGVKARHPQVKIVAGNTSGTPLPWFTDFIDAGGLRYCDMLSTHGYARDLDTTLAGVTALDALVKRRNGGVSKPIIVSEIGVSNTTSTARSGNIARVQTEEQAATALVKIFAGLRSNPAVVQTVWYDGVDDGSRPDETEDNFGLYRQPTDTVAAFQPKQSAAAAGYLMRQLEGYRFSSRRSLGSDVWMYTFVDGTGTQRRILWRDAPYADTTTGAATVSVTARSGYRTTVSSLTGEAVGAPLAPGTSRISVGTEPIYLDEVPAAS